MTTRRQSFTQSDVVRAVKGVLAAGLSVYRVIATERGVEIVTAEGVAAEARENEWDEVLDDGKTG